MRKRLLIKTPLDDIESNVKARFDYAMQEMEKHGTEIDIVYLGIDEEGNMFHELSCEIKGE